jgi:hypothetical protein
VMQRTHRQSGRGGELADRVPRAIHGANRKVCRDVRVKRK